MTLGIFQRILAALSRLNMSPEQLVRHLEFSASLAESKKETEQ